MCSLLYSAMLIHPGYGVIGRTYIGVNVNGTRAKIKCRSIKHEIKARRGDAP